MTGLELRSAMACAGQVFAQTPQPMHFPESTPGLDASARSITLPNGPAL